MTLGTYGLFFCEPLVMRDPLLNDVAIPRAAATEDRADESEWDGLGYADILGGYLALGVVLEHCSR